MRTIRLIALLLLSSMLLRDTQTVSTQAANCPNAPAPRLVIGREARVTPGTPNNLREQPSKSAKLLTQIPGDSFLFVIGGPVCADGFAYWQVEYGSQTGWTPEGSGKNYFIEPLTSAVSVVQVAPNSKTVTVQYGQVTLTYNGAFGPRAEASKVFEVKPLSDDPYTYPTPEFTEFRFGVAKDQNARYRQAMLGVYPLPAYIKINESVKTSAGGLTAALKAQQLPKASSFGPIPPVHAGQVFHAQVKFFQFNGGKGVRYLTMYAQDVSPVVNERLVYVYQGLTDNGNYVISATFPLRTDALPNKYEDVKDFPDFSGTNAGDLYEAYMKKTTAALDQLKLNAFQPSLDDLDAIVQSIVIK